jgi:hypothetical protein
MMPKTAKPDLATTETKPKSWRDVIAIHPAADLFPLMPTEELRALGEDIKAHGLRTPIVIFDERTAVGKNEPHRCKLLDGRNRLDAMELVGIEFELVFMKHGSRLLWHLIQPNGDMRDCVRHEWSDGLDPYAYVISANVRRRHLTTEQKRDVLEKLFREKPEMSGLQASKLVGTSPTTAIKVKQELANKGDVSNLETSKDTKGRKQPARKAKAVKSKPTTEKPTSPAAPVAPEPTTAGPRAPPAFPDLPGGLDRRAESITPTTSAPETEAALTPEIASEAQLGDQESTAERKAREARGAEWFTKTKTAWLKDHPGQTADDFERVTTCASTAEEHDTFWAWEQTYRLPETPTKMLDHIAALIAVMKTCLPSGLIHTDDSQIARSSSSSRHESRNCRQRHPGRPPST